MKIKIHVFKESIGLQAFDRLYAFRQSLNKNYQSDVSISFGEPESGSINIAFMYMPKRKLCDLDLYDLIILDNAGEPLETATPLIKELLSNDKVYFLCGAFLTDTHLLYKKVIPFNHNIRLFHDVMVRGFYPQYFERATADFQRVGDICYINGANRSNRQYMINLLSDIGIPVKSSLSDGIAELPDCQFEDQYDIEFRTFVNHQFKTQYHQNHYYNQLITLGINAAFGEIPKGYFIIDEYYQYQCILFPETQWVNNQHFMTEKIFKCFVSGSIPWPIAGANIHQMYNQLGYQTAWNLLPVEHQMFDTELDHKKRYNKIIAAISWLKQNRDILKSTAAQELVHQNRYNFFTNTIDMITVQILQQVLDTVAKSNVAK